jgi:hypothetical protein
MAGEIEHSLEDDSDASNCNAQIQRFALDDLMVYYYYAIEL